MQQASATGLVIRSANADDAEHIANIYNHYILTSTITFEDEPVSAAEMAARVAEVQASSFPWLIAQRERTIAGFAYGQKWKVRAAYKFSSEVTVYVRDGMKASGVGSALYAQLLPLLKTQGIHLAIGGVALPNNASVRLHEKFGFHKVAHFEEVGFKFNRWVDVAYWQLKL